MSKIESLGLEIIDRILSEQNEKYRKLMGIDVTGEKVLNIIKEQLSATESVFKIDWTVIPDYVDLDAYGNLSLKKEYSPKILLSRYIDNKINSPYKMIKAFDDDILMTDTYYGLYKFNPQDPEKLSVVIPAQYNTNGYRYFEDNNRIYGGHIIKFSTDAGNYYAIFMYRGYGLFVVKIYNEDFEYIGMTECNYSATSGPGVEGTFASNFRLYDVTALDANNIFLTSQYGGNTDDSGNVIGDNGVVYVGYIETDSNGIPTGFKFHRKTDGYPFAIVGVQERYINSGFYIENASRVNKTKFVDGKLYTCHTNKLQKYNYVPSDGISLPIVEFEQELTTPPEIIKWTQYWTVTDLFIKEENGIKFMYAVVKNAPTLYGIAKIYLDKFQLVSFVGKYVNIGGRRHYSLTAEGYESEDTISTYFDVGSPTSFGNIVSMLEYDDGVIILDQSNYNVKKVPYELFNTISYVESDEYSVPDIMEVIKPVVGSYGIYEININNTGWKELDGKYFKIGANTPFKFRRKIYPYEFIDSPINVDLRLLVQ